MNISLSKIYPAYFSNQDTSQSEVWKQELHFSKGEHIHIVAPSGSGKTSLIHFLYGLRKEYEGDILYNNEKIKDFSAEQFSNWRKQHISIVFQDLRLFPEQTVFQNLEVKRVLQPFHAESRIESMAKRLGIHDKLNRKCSTCSYGEQQRIAIIRSLQQPFDFLLLDEPFSHLDETNRSKAMELMLEEAGERNACVVLADLKQIEYFKADRVLTV